MARPPGLADVADGRRAGELAVVTRSGVVESRHLGHAALVDPGGRVVAAVGDPATVILPRSSVKPWQAATIRRLGATFTGTALGGEALAITAGSHTGTRRHRALVAAMLDDGGLAVGALRCPADLPGDAQARLAVGRRSGGGAAPFAHNCSGKHAGMLLACRANGWPTDSYLAPDHPLQVAIRADLEEAVGVAVVHVAVDGCGAPLLAVPLDGLARAAARFPQGRHGRRAVGDAMRSHPWAVAGPSRPDTVVMEHLDGVVAKAGAEGVQLLVTDTGWAVVVKVLDGARRAAMTAGLALLAHVPGIDLSGAADATGEVVLGGGGRVGDVLPGADVSRSR